MGTKANPGDYDGYAKAERDEPIFVLLARDASAPELVREWASQRRRRGVERAFNSDTEGAVADIHQAADAEECALRMESWRKEYRSAPLEAFGTAELEDALVKFSRQHGLGVERSEHLGKLSLQMVMGMVHAAVAGEPLEHGVARVGAGILSGQG